MVSAEILLSESLDKAHEKQNGGDKRDMACGRSLEEVQRD